MHHVVKSGGSNDLKFIVINCDLPSHSTRNRARTGLGHLQISVEGMIVTAEHINAVSDCHRCSLARTAKCNFVAVSAMDKADQSVPIEVAQIDRMIIYDTKSGIAASDRHGRRCSRSQTGNKLAVESSTIAWVGKSSTRGGARRHRRGAEAVPHSA